MNERTWHSGPPPHVGWWNASKARTPDPWRWWDGRQWSVAWYPDSPPGEYLGVAQTHDMAIEWSDYYPWSARVPRVDPSKPENKGVVACINMCIGRYDFDGFWSQKAREWWARRNSVWPDTVQGLPPELAKHAEGYAEQLRAERGHTETRRPIITLDEAHARYRTLTAELHELNESAAWARGAT